MDKLKTVGKTLALISGVLETSVAFIFYWVIFSITNEGPQTLSMVVLMCGILGGVLLFISSFYIKSTKLVGAILSGIAVILSLTGTIYLICNSNGNANIANSIMVVLPFFVVPNSIGIACLATILATIFIKEKPVEKKVENKEEPKEIVEVKEVETKEVVGTMEVENKEEPKEDKKEEK